MKRKPLQIKPDIIKTAMLIKELLKGNNVIDICENIDMKEDSVRRFIRHLEHVGVVEIIGKTEPRITTRLRQNGSVRAIYKLKYSE